MKNALNINKLDDQERGGEEWRGGGAKIHFCKNGIFSHKTSKQLSLARRSHIGGTFHRRRRNTITLLARYVLREGAIDSCELFITLLFASK